MYDARLAWCYLTSRLSRKRIG